MTKPTSQRQLLAVLGALACLHVSSPALARDTERLLAAHELAASDQGKSFLLAVPFFMKGEPHPAVEQELATTEVSRAASGALRSDRSACGAAFLDALKVLQQNALNEGGDALVDVVSTTRGEVSESPVDFRCVAGAAVVHVGLRGRVVRLAK